MFDMGALSALAIERRFQYWVELETLPRQADAPAGGGSSWFRVGFTDSGQPDVAAEFPGHVEPDRSYEAQSQDWAMLILGDWPELSPAIARTDR